LLDENDRWRRSALAQLDYMFELGAEFRSGRRAPTPTGFRIPAAPNSSRDLR
jgi:hypothetical protein